MKKSTIPSFVLLGLTLLSLFCYVYLHKVAFVTTGRCPSSTLAMEAERSATEKSQTLLPDIALVKQLLNVSKMVLTKGE